MRTTLPTQSMDLFTNAISEKEVSLEPILSLIERYSPQSEDQRLNQERFIDLVRGKPYCLLRTAFPAHITGSAWILNQDSSAVLLHHHKKLGIWVQLGGHADGCADIRAVALREAEEESGISGFEVMSESIFDLDIHTIPAHDTEPEHLHYDIRFILRAPMGAIPVCSDESNQISWIPISKLSEVTSEESILRMARKSCRC